MKLAKEVETRKRRKFDFRRLFSGIASGWRENTSIAKVVFGHPSEDCSNYEVCPVRAMLTLKVSASRLARVASIAITVARLALILWDGTSVMPVDELPSGDTMK